MLQFCETNDITFVAFAPLGGHRNPTALETVPPLIELAAAEGITVRQLALLFLKSLFSKSHLDSRLDREGTHH